GPSFTPGKEAAALYVPPIELQHKENRIQLLFDDSATVTGFELPIHDGKDGAILRELFTRRWGPPVREVAEDEHGGTAYWDGRSLHCYRGACDLRAGTAVR